MTASAAGGTQGSSHADISASTTRAGFWLLGGKFSSRLLDLLSLLVLARLLTPEDFALVAIATSVLVIVETVLDVPVVQALVRLRPLTAAMLSTALTLSILRAVAICVVILALAWPLAWAYGDPRLSALLAVLALAPAARSLFSPGLVHFMQRFDFRPEFALDLVQKGVTFLVAVSVALLTASYWSLAAASVAGPAVAAAASYVVAPMRPGLALSEWPRFRDMVGWHSLSQVLSALNWQLDRLLMPHFVELRLFGNFAVADNLASIPHQTFVGPLIRPLMSAFARLEAASPALTAAYLKAMHALVLVGGSVLTVLAFLAVPVVSFVAGREWTDAGFILQWLCLASLLSLSATIMPPLAMVLDRTRYATLRMAIEFAAKVPLMLAGLVLFGLMGALWARVASNLVASVTSALLARRLIGVGLARQFATVCAALLPTVPMIAFLLFARAELARGDTVDVVFVLSLAASMAIALGLFWISALLLWTLRGRPAGLEATLVRMAGDFVGARRAVFRRFGNKRAGPSEPLVKGE